MQPAYDLSRMSAIILDMKQRADELKRIGSDFPALDRNLVRILASLKMLEINICDAVSLERRME